VHRKLCVWISIDNFRRTFICAIIFCHFKLLLIDEIKGEKNEYFMAALARQNSVCGKRQVNFRPINGNGGDVEENGREKSAECKRFLDLHKIFHDVIIG